MCINEQSLREIEALEGKKLFTETKILMKFLCDLATLLPESLRGDSGSRVRFSRRNLEKIYFICSYRK